MKASFPRWLAFVLVRFAAQLLPAARAEWAQAMWAEFDHLEEDRDALGWAFGCVAAGFKERVNVMLVGDLKMPRWLLAPEMLLCFVPLTIAWLDATAGVANIASLNGEAVHRYFLDVRGGTMELVAVVAGATLGALGPLGLLAASRLLVLGRSIRSGWLHRALVLGPALFGALTVIAHAAIGGPGSLSLRSLDAFDFWSGIFLMSALPALGAAHLRYLGPPVPEAGAVSAS